MKAKKFIYAAYAIGHLGRTVEQEVIGPLSGPQLYRQFITAH